MKKKVAPRIYCIPATQAPIVAVFRRGPADWSHVGRWDLEERRYEPGAWFHGRIFPRRSDLSPDGRFLCYFAHKPTAVWEHGKTYVAVSKLPWLTALHASRTHGTWTRGYHFTKPEDRDSPKSAKLPIPKPEDCYSLNSAKLPILYGLRSIPVVQFATERLHGWDEAPDSPQRISWDRWDERRNARMQKRQPGGTALLCVESLGSAGGEFGNVQAIDGLRVSYWLEAYGDIQLLPDVQWADWDRDGHLLVATRSGKLQIWNLTSHQVLFEADLSSSEPSPAPAPKWARRW
ncbi:hypothetical protein [Kouleothrix sp.]|uniref:hypothetical protein n=1 Tax=Kouleothrix sp. TaxID=2779161 RepID=UPI003919C00C